MLFIELATLRDKRQFKKKFCTVTQNPVSGGHRFKKKYWSKIYNFETKNQN